MHTFGPDSSPQGINQQLKSASACADTLQVEDIIDSGHTLNRLSQLLKQAGADSVKVVALLDKKGRRRVDFFPDYVGWEVRDSLAPFSHLGSRLPTVF